jgi:protein phosphatase 2C family protein 2/3
MSKAKTAVDLSRDHKPDCYDESQRIYAANSFIEGSRVNGMLALSRALGDFDYKCNTTKRPRDQAVTAFPEIRCHMMTPDTEFLLLACDGIWDVLSSQEAINLVH